jgi:hypothetical protein
MSAYRIVTSVGLTLDLAGTLALWRFGLPAEVNRSGEQALLDEKVDFDAVRRARRYDSAASIAVGLLVLSFFLQLVANPVL